MAKDVAGCLGNATDNPNIYVTYLSSHYVLLRQSNKSTLKILGARAG